MEINNIINKNLSYTKAAPLAVFRILFGFVLVLSIIRFWYNGWIEKLYVNPNFHFHYQGFEFINVPGDWIYPIFIICGLSAFLVSIGYQYRIAIFIFFLSFTYIELLDKTTYLNHYYYVSVLSFILIFLPANCTYSLDAYFIHSVRAKYIQRWNINILKFFVALVYIFAGLAKLNYDWLINAMPLTIWLPSKSDIPLIGSLLQENWMPYLFSWGGAIYDLGIVFLLMIKKTRKIAFFFVVVFHVLTRVLFPIGMFPYIMIISTLIFFDDRLHEKILSFLDRLFKLNFNEIIGERQISILKFDKIKMWILGTVMLLQILIPLRFLLYSGNVFWTEQGYRFSWRVMLMEKTAYANFKIVDGKTQKRFYVQNDDFLTPFQQKQMSTQPDFILEYGQYLGKHFESQGHKNVEVYVESFAALNGRASQGFIDPNVNLMDVNYSKLCSEHIIPLAK